MYKKKVEKCFHCFHLFKNGTVTQKIMHRCYNYALKIALLWWKQRWKQGGGNKMLPPMQHSREIPMFPDGDGSIFIISRVGL